MVLTQESNVDCTSKVLEVSGNINKQANTSARTHAKSRSFHKKSCKYNFKNKQKSA